MELPGERALKAEEILMASAKALRWKCGSCVRKSVSSEETCGWS